MNQRLERLRARLAPTKPERPSITTKVSLVLSLFAFLLSVGNAYMSVRNFGAERTAVLFSKPVVEKPVSNEDFSTVVLAPHDEDILVQRIKVTFPRFDFDQGHTVEIRYPRLHLDTSVALLNLLSDVMPRFKNPGSKLNFCAGSFPAVLEIDYVAKGERFVERSLYEFTFTHLVLFEARQFGAARYPHLTGMYFVRTIGSEKGDELLVKRSEDQYCKWEYKR
jgi:hypothetical protein